MLRRNRALALLPLVGASLWIAAAACTRADKSDAALGQDTTLARDLQLANTDTASAPQLKDVPAPDVKAAQSTNARARASNSKIAPPTQRRTEPSLPSHGEPARANETGANRTPPPPHPVETQPMRPITFPTDSAGAAKGDAAGVIPAGALLSLSSGQRVCTNTHAVGDRFTATLADPVEGTNGASIPRGATAVLELTTLKRAEGPRDSAYVRFAIRAIAFGGKSYPATGEVTQEQVDRVAAPDNGNAKKVAAGAAIGAIAGQLFGHKTKSTVIGAATGAAVGAGVALATERFDGCVPNGGRIVVRLTQPITLLKT